MDNNDSTLELLNHIRSNQELMIQNQQIHIDLVKKHLERSERQIEESLKLQQYALERQRKLMIFAAPVIIICVLLAGFLIFTYLI